MCRAILDGVACECEQYDAPKNEDAPPMCRECGHGKSRHSTVAPIAPVAIATSNKAVLDLFNLRSDRRIAEVLPAKAQLMDFSAAKEDALRNYRRSEDDPKAAYKAKKVDVVKKTAPPSKSKEIIISELVLFTCGVNKFTLCGSAKAPTRIDIDQLASYKFVAKDVALNQAWSHEEFTTKLRALFPEAFQWLAGVTSESSSSDHGSWVLLNKHYQTLQVLRNVSATGSDAAKYTIKTAHGLLLYIALNHPDRLPKTVYRAWYTGRPEEQDTSSVNGEGGDEDLLQINSAEDDFESSDYDLSRDHNAYSEGEAEVHVVPGRYDMRLEPPASKRKRESIESISEDEQPPSKKLKLAGNKSSPAAPGPSTPTQSSLEPLFIRRSSLLSTKKDDKKGKGKHRNAAEHICTCMKVSSAPTVVYRQLHSLEDLKQEAYDQDEATFVNPWHAAYKPPYF
ncbi:hypothetical protein C8R45DRAFT_936448 [Mycena sanguinolenta]|nr:hypothetical protein C8R45DRAFT_936448 [Mycena sanguinolenta]